FAHASLLRSGFIKSNLVSEESPRCLTLSADADNAQDYPRWAQLLIGLRKLCHPRNRASTDC
ncbi:MAG: hypothetical protein UIQ97_02095, partial [Eggerthellaceae bacterium]